MSRSTRPKGKVVRRLGINLYGNQKYDKLLKRKKNPPGEIHRSRRKQSEYARQLVEKQKLKFAYGLTERQFRNLFAKAKQMSGVTGDNMLQLLERRLDNVVYRLGMTASRPQARQIVSHGHIQVNGRTVKVSSAIVKTTDKIKVKERKASTNLVRGFLAKSTAVIPEWLTLTEDDLSGIVNHLPERSEIPTIANEQLVVEYYAK